MLVTLRDAARRLNRPSSTVWYRVHHSTIPRMKVGKALVVNLDDVKRLFDKKPAA
jgi:hypothetical protein